MFTATYFDTILGLTMVRVEFKKNQSSINQWSAVLSGDYGRECLVATTSTNDD